jgi:hypothetical protein
MVRILLFTRVVTRMSAVHEHARRRFVSTRSDKRNAVLGAIRLAVCGECGHRLTGLATDYAEQHSHRKQAARHDI